MVFVPNQLPPFGEPAMFEIEGVHFQLWCMIRDTHYELKSSVGHIGYVRAWPGGKYSWVSDNVAEGPVDDWRVLVARHTNGEIGPDAEH